MELKNKGTRAAIELFLLSFISLYLELLVIRWLSTEIRAFTIFRTFPLISCFVGLGLGFALGKDKIFKWTPLCLLFFVQVMKLSDVMGVGFWNFPSSSIYQWGRLMFPQEVALYLVIFMVVLVILLLGPFALMVCIGSRLGVLFNSLKPLQAYSYNVSGAIAGSIAFPILSYLRMSPWELLIPGAILLAAYILLSERPESAPGGSTPLPKFRLNTQAALTLVIIPVVAFHTPSTHNVPMVHALQAYQRGETQTYFSPYQRIDVALMETKPADGTEPKLIGLELGVNRAFYQYYFNEDANKADVSPELAQLLQERQQQYSLPYILSSPKTVLVVGAGTGQNASSALEYGATSVDAVDIDPVILELGKKFNKAYSSDKVHTVCDDARHFMSQCNKKYDLINFSLLDSHVVTGQGSSVRIDCYVYTRESIANALRLLNPNGTIVLSFAAVAPWVGPRIYSTMESAAGYPPLVIRPQEANTWGNADIFFVLGDSVKNGTLKAPPGWREVSFNKSANTRILTDDWPYLYVQPENLDVSYLLVVGEVLLLSLLASRRVLFGKTDYVSWQMFFLGAAFLLLELHAISFLSLLYGSTWVTSAVVINSILAMILLANFFVIKGGPKVTTRQPVIYAVLIASILASYLMPGDQLIHNAQGMSIAIYALVTIVTILPMGVAGVLFASAFSTAEDSARALAFNLFGALVGGLLEYLSNYTGIKALELVAAGLYLTSLACYMIGRSKVQANVDGAQTNA